MSVMYILLPLALVFAGVAVAVFAWAALSGQYDDIHTPAVRILHDDEPAGHDHEPAGTTNRPPAPSRRGP